MSGVKWDIVYITVDPRAQCPCMPLNGLRMASRTSHRTAFLHSINRQRYSMILTPFNDDSRGLFRHHEVDIISDDQQPDRK